VDALERRYPSLRRHLVVRFALRVVFWSILICFLYGGLWMALALTGASVAKVSEMALVGTVVLLGMLVVAQLVRWLTFQIRRVTLRDTTPNKSLERTREG
jgi:hypothetical protein